MYLLSLLACAPDVRAIIDADRPEHYFDLPFPSDEHHLVDGRPDLTGYPLAEPPLTADLEGGWAARLQTATTGFSNNGAAYLRFDGPLDLPSQTSGTPDDPVVMVSLDGDAELLPLEVRFIDDAGDDPHWGDHTLAVAPALGHPPRSGGRYAVVVRKAAGAAPPKGWDAPDEVHEALDAAGVKGGVASATVFTVQDATGELRALAAEVDARTGDWQATTWRRVVEIRYEAGETESGNEATVFTARFEDGSERVAYLSYDPDEVQTIDLTDWPMSVWEVDVPTLNFQPEADRPYMSPGLLTIQDTDRFTGWIDVDAAGVHAEPWVESMRVTVSIPLDGSGQPRDAVGVVLWDHGTAGHAYNIVQRANVNDDSRALAQVFADEGWVVVGRDASLYGTRYPLIDEGYGGSLGFYNVVNLPAFRDNQRQTAIDGHLLANWVQDRLADELPEGTADTSRLRRAGHSLGSVTTNLGVAAAPDRYESAFLSGTGGVFTHYFLDTGLVATIDPSLVSSLFPLFGADAPEEITTQSVAGAILGIDEQMWPHVDRLHPLLTLFQWTMDPSDPMATARDETLPTFLSISPGDYQTPDFTAEALAIALPDATVRTCQATSTDYDPHHCLWREDDGPEILREWLQQGAP